MSRDTETLPNDFVAIIEYNGYVLAEKDYEYSESKKQYVTWMQNDRGVTLGHYFMDKSAAQEDFVLRTELVNSNKLFNSDELSVLYKALKDYDAAGDFDYDDKKLGSSIESARTKLESIPDVDIDKYTKIKVLIIEPNRTPRTAKIINDLHTFQDLVGGYIDLTYPNQDNSVAVIFNEEGRPHGLSPNKVVNGNMYVGTLVIAGCNENGDFCSLKPIQIETYKIMMDTKEKHKEVADIAFEK